MVFSSFVFLFIFLPIVLLVYYVCPKKCRNFILLIASLIFYAWGEPKYVLIMLFSTVFDYTNGRLIEKAHQKQNRKMAKAVLIVDICGNLGILGFFKYTDFLIGSVGSLTGLQVSLLHIALPIGISFYTFQTMSYTIDVYKGIVPAQHNILNFATYVTLFPQLIAGPIVQYKTIGEELESRKVSAQDFAEGAFRFTVGLAKKVVLANQIGSLWTAISNSQDLTMATAWLGAIAFTFQIYFDFSGYSDMAIGLGRMFGFHFLENFDHPYLSKSVTEFWRRWHISLGTWFREYVYIPLGGNRQGIAKQIRNILIVWMLTGLWHGANWNFVIWGLYYGFWLMLEKILFSRRGDIATNKVHEIGGHFYTMVLVIVGWAIFAVTDLAQLGSYLKTMLGIGATLVDGRFFYYLTNNAVLFILLIICSLDLRTPIRRFAGKCKERSSVLFALLEIVTIIVLLGLSMAFLVGDSYNPFLYFRF